MASNISGDGLSAADLVAADQALAGAAGVSHNVLDWLEAQMRGGSTWAQAVTALQAAWPAKLQPSAAALAAWQANVTARASAKAQATGTATCTGVVAGDKLTIQGVDFTAVAANPVGNQFAVGADDPTTAANLAAAITASPTWDVAGAAGLGGLVYATSAGNVVTVASVESGLPGNTITLAQTGGHIGLSAATLTGGTDSTTQAY
jgi:hypothetical protein